MNVFTLVCEYRVDGLWFFKSRCLPSKFTDCKTDGKMDPYVGAWNGQEKLQNEPHFFLLILGYFGFSVVDTEKQPNFLKI